MIGLPVVSLELCATSPEFNGHIERVSLFRWSWHEALNQQHSRRGIRRDAEMQYHNRTMA